MGSNHAVDSDSILSHGRDIINFFIFLNVEVVDWGMRRASPAFVWNVTIQIANYTRLPTSSETR